jgi:hypothetical protein
MVDRFEIEPPITADLEGRDLLFLQHAINSRRMHPKIPGNLFKRQYLSHSAPLDSLRSSAQLKYANNLSHHRQPLVGSKDVLHQVLSIIADPRDTVSGQGLTNIRRVRSLGPIRRRGAGNGSALASAERKLMNLGSPS